MDGFALLGIETHADVSMQDLDSLLNDLYRSKQRALVYLQQDLADCDLPILHLLRSEGGNILISVVPDLLSADDYHAPVDKLISRVLGQNIAAGG